MLKKSLLLGSTLLLTTAIAAPAFAQDDEIIVTATKRTQTLQETPVAVTVTNAATIEKARILDIQDLQTVVPSLRVNQLQTSQNVNFIIRGFGNGANNAGIEPSVGVFIDGVYRSRSAAQIGDLPKLQRVEVLSGPQSTLFGKNASAGVISIATAAPSFETEGYVEAGIGNYNEFLLKGYVTTGLSDNAAVSLGGSFNKRDGFFASSTGLSSVNDRNRWNVRGQFLLEPTDETSIRVIADYNQIDEVCCAVTNIINEGAAGALRFLGGPNAIANENDPFALTSFFDSDPINTVDDYGVSLHIDHDFSNFALTSISSYRANDSFYDQDADYSNIDSLTVSSDQEIKTITQEIRLTSTGDNTLDWMLGGYYFSEDINQVGGLDFGVDTRPYFDLLTPPGALQGIEDALGITRGTFFGNQTETVETFTQDNTAFSIFGNVDFHVSDRLTVTGGLNYTDDSKSVTGSTVNNETFSDIEFDGAGGQAIVAAGVFANGQAAIPAAGVPFIPSFAQAFAPLTLADLTGVATGAFGPALQAAFGNYNTGVQGFAAATVASPANPLLGLQALQFQPQFVSFPNAVESGKSDDSQLTWTARAAYEISDNLNGYVSAATGFKSTSWNLARDSRPFVADQAALENAGLTQNNQNYASRFAGPEDALVFEAGLKGKFDGGAFNFAVFNQSIKNFQSNSFIGGGFVLSNAGKTTVNGAELGVDFRPTDGLTVGFDATYLDAKFNDFQNATGPNIAGDGSDATIDRSGEKVSGIPELAFSAYMDYTHEFSDGTVGYIHADYQRESEVAISSVLRTLPRSVSEEIKREISTVNASVGMKLENGLGVQLWSRNLFGDEYIRTIFPGVAATGIVNGYRNSPTTWGVNLRKDF